MSSFSSCDALLSRAARSAVESARAAASSRSARLASLAAASARARSASNASRKLPSRCVAPTSVILNSLCAFCSASAALAASSRAFEASSLLAASASAAAFSATRRASASEDARVSALLARASISRTLASSSMTLCSSSRADAVALSAFCRSIAHSDRDALSAFVASAPTANLAASLKNPPKRSCALGPSASARYVSTSESIRASTESMLASGAFAAPITRVDAAAKSSEHRADAAATRRSRYSRYRPCNARSSFLYAAALVSGLPTARASNTERACSIACAWHTDNLASSMGVSSAAS